MAPIADIQTYFWEDKLKIKKTTSDRYTEKMHANIKQKSG